jgi:hypothetical protein
MFRSNNSSDLLGPFEPTVVSNAPKIKYTCTCGCTRFKWDATNGEIRSGGFIPDEYVYVCLGCGKKIEEEQVKKYFGRF